MLPYKKDEIDKILQCSYYDRRTDYVWNYLMGGRDLLKEPFPIPGLDSFKVTHNMMRHRKASIAHFLEEWKTQDHPGLTRCTYDKKSDTLCVKARTFQFIYHEQSHEYYLVAKSDVAKAINIKERELKKRYKNHGLFPIADLVELDEQLFSRYDEKIRLRKWRRSPQFEVDRSYCEQMLSFIMEKSQEWNRYLGYYQRLNIILIGNDRVKIGIVEDYSPEEMIGLPSYPREDWRLGIQNALDKAEKEYAEVLAAHAQEMKLWSDQLSKLVLGQTPYCLEERAQRYFLYISESEHIHALKCEAMGIPVEDEEDQPRPQSSLHQQLVEEVRFIIQQTSPLIAYTGPCQLIKDEYYLRMEINEYNQIEVSATLSDGTVTETFDLETYRSSFRVWWSRLMLKECKQAKEYALHPETGSPFAHF